MNYLPKKKIISVVGALIIFLIASSPNQALSQDPNFEPGVQKIYNIAGRDWLIWIPSNTSIKHRLLVSTTGNNCNDYNAAIGQGPAYEIHTVTSGVHRDKFVVATMIRKSSENNSQADPSEITAGLDIIFQYGSSFIYTTPNTSFFTGLSQGNNELYRYLSNWCTVVMGGTCTTPHREKFRGQISVMTAIFEPSFYTTFRPHYNWVSSGATDPWIYYPGAQISYFSSLYPDPKTKGFIYPIWGHILQVSHTAWSSSGNTASTNVWLWMLNESYGEELLVAPKIILQGAYNSGTGLMNDNLQSSSLLPLTEPYTGLTNFTHTGGGGGETVPSTTFSSTGTAANDIVDWVFVQLHDGSTGNVVATRSALVQRDGDIVTVHDGTGEVYNYVGFKGFSNGNYYVSVRHRNHIGIRTPTQLALTQTSITNYDFTTAAAQSLNSIQANLGSGKFGMFGGDGQANGSTRYTGPSASNDNFFLLNTTLGGNKTNTSLNEVYISGDYNMDGKVRYVGPSAINDNFFLLTIVLSGNKTNTSVTQPF